MKNKGEVMMEADYSPGDTKSLSEEKENAGANTPVLDESIERMSPKCKQEEMPCEKVLNISELDKNVKGVNGDSDSESNQDGMKPRKKHRRRHRGGKNHRKWKPYDKMSWREKQDLEEKETRRATQKREDAFASGHPVAPYNTTQFLMDDHFKNEAISPDLHRHNSKDSNTSNSTDTSSDFYEDDENDGFQQKNFMDTFNDLRKQELLSKTKDDLVRDYVDLELKLERLEQTSTLKRGDVTCDGNSVSSGGERDTNEVSVTEYLRLKAENETLRKTNLQLQAKLKGEPPVEME